MHLGWPRSSNTLNFGGCAPQTTSGSALDDNSKRQTLQSSSEANARILGRTLQVQEFGGAAPKVQRVWAAQLPKAQRVSGPQPSRMQTSLRTAAPQGNPSFQFGCCMSKIKTDMAVWYNLEQNAWISFGRCSSSDPVVSRGAAPFGLPAH